MDKTFSAWIAVGVFSLGLALGASSVNAQPKLVWETEGFLVLSPSCSMTPLAYSTSPTSTANRPKQMARDIFPNCPGTERFREGVGERSQRA